MSSTEHDKKKREEEAREAALWDPDSVFHDLPAETTASRAAKALTATENQTAKQGEADDPDKPASLYARSERRRPTGLTREMIKRIADRAEQAAKDKK